MSHVVLWVVSSQLQQAEFFTLMTDECVECANNEQLVICFRSVGVDLEAHEEFIALYQCTDITAVAVLKDTLLRLNLQLSRCRGQCYGGGSNMAGSKNGVKAQILKEEPRALFTHCYGHALSLSVADTE